MPRIGIIAAISEDRALALRGRIPWDEPSDRARFKRITVGTTVVMGRRTWLDLPRRPLPDRRNVVLTSRPLDGVEAFCDLPDALAACPGDVWLIGGVRVYEAGFAHADEIDLTRVPIRVPDPEALRMPPIPEAFERVSQSSLPEAPHLVVETYRRRPA